MTKKKTKQKKTLQHEIQIDYISNWTLWHKISTPGVFKWWPMGQIKIQSFIFGPGSVSKYRETCRATWATAFELSLVLENPLSTNSVVELIKNHVSCTTLLSIIQNNKFQTKHGNLDVLNFKSCKTLTSALIMCHSDYACSSWYSALSQKYKNQLQIIQNKIVCFIMGEGPRTHNWPKWAGQCWYVIKLE